MDNQNQVPKKKWYLSTWIIALCFALWVLVAPPIIGIILLVLQSKESKSLEKWYTEKSKLLDDIGVTRYTDLTEKIEKEKNDFEVEKQNLVHEIEAIKQEKSNHEKSIEDSRIVINELNESIERLENNKDKKDKQLKTQINKIKRIKEIYKSIEYSIETFFEYEPAYENIILPDSIIEEIKITIPSVILKLHHMDVKDLRKAFKENDKAIEKILTQYQSRYTTKTNQAIYQLMVIALRAELQNILYSLKYDKLDTAVENIKQVTQKYLKIASEGNQSIASTLTKFIGEIEYLFINAAKIEYNYYVKKEKIKQEQLALRQQMREEAEERKILKKQREKVEREELKFKNEIEKAQELLNTTDNTDELEKLKSKILELQGQLTDVTIKKEEISNLQNGKAGNVYIISNLGSFGDQVFKIGMTRRIDPQERINELGSASVPFKFDVHSFIFSEDAVALENELHNRLNNKRLNKVNMRKEFFNCSIDELEDLVNELDQTAEFNRTMLAEEYKQSLSTQENYDTTSTNTENSDINETALDD
ncbi:GIY-YIG nuclease family protein [Clostridium sp. D2Q-14]|uniref:GIY-YIG nuclease family protein n=1 Tax=Anaeromonas gelatinilytica TaxID=2683194 RepID=UPI00193BB221|nr:GIY-YIG nuclease family protein [Anaeromonas gelatinilytica]MBS4534471.1 GIY-YIG nuclease family protein [Anaeromonas gelatinilytica]